MMRFTRRCIIVRGARKMKILFAASEAFPFMASGGLADVAGSLPKALYKDGQDCRIVMPLYGDIRSELKEKMKYITNFTVPLAWRRQYCGVFEAQVDGVTYYFLDNEYYFKRKGIYGFYDDAERFSFFAKAILEMLNYIDFAPEIIHCNDWQTALTPVYLNLYFRHNPKFQNIRTVFTIHNIQYQGRYGMEIVEDVMGIPKYAGSMVELEGCSNMMKGAIEQSDMVTTVSPTYAWEITDPWFSHGLDELLRRYNYKLTGILNGIDGDVYNPETDPNIVQNYSVKTVSKKKVDKKDLVESFGLEYKEEIPVIGMVGRMVAHKGLDLVKYIVNQFAEDKDSVEYEVNEKERVIEIVVTLPASDMGKVIGKQGKIAKAMRTIVRAATPKNGKKYVVEIKEKGGNAVDRDDGGDETEETEEA